MLRSRYDSAGLKLDSDHHRALADARNIARLLPWVLLELISELERAGQIRVATLLTRASEARISHAQHTSR